MRMNKIEGCTIKISYSLLFLFFSNFIYAQNDLSIDDYSFVSEHKIESIEKSLRFGSRAFAMELEETKKDYVVKNYTKEKYFSHLLDTIDIFFKKNEQAMISLLLKGEFKQDRLLAYLDAYFSNRILFYDKENSYKLNSLKKQGIQILVIFESDLAATSIAQIRKEKKYLNRFSSDPLDKLILFNATAKKDSTLLSNVFELWELTGKPPNFIIAPKIKITALKNIVDSLNRTRRFRGIVEYNGKKLNEIFWRKSPHS